MNAFAAAVVVAFGWFLLLVGTTVRCFAPPLATTRSPSSSSSSSSRIVVVPPLRSSKKSSDDGDWELLEDWVLQDRVPDFTVNGSAASAGAGATATTFWRQLKHATPELSTRTESELERRYAILAEKSAADEKAGSTTTTTTPGDDVRRPGAAFVSCGKSPEVLTGWWLDVVEQRQRRGTNNDAAAVAMMHGRLSNGSGIWFPLRSAGTVGGPPPPPSSSRSDEEGGFSWLGDEEGDYVRYAESPSGCVYELGAPRPPPGPTSSGASSNDVGVDPASSSSGSFASDDRARDDRSSPSAMTNTNANTVVGVGTTLAAVVASSVLSASLAFSSVGSLPWQQQTIPTAATTTTTATTTAAPSQAVTPAILGSGMKYERTYSPSSRETTKVIELSIGEQRASQELRVYREERKLEGLREKLATDEASLRDLKTTEDRLGTVAASEPLVNGAPRSPRELPISEQRARAELKIGVDKRRIDRMTESLKDDRAKLKALRAQERQINRPSSSLSLFGRDD